MEPESSRAELEDQLQGSAVQNQELQAHSGPPELAQTPAPAPAPPASQGTKVIVHFSDRVVKGFVDRNSDGGARRPGVICVRRLDGILEEIALTQTQGVYFVKEFEENSNHSNLLFYNLPPLERLWVRLTFKDGDVIEGMIENGVHFVLNPGFLVTPTDPTGNNRMIFVMKTQLRDFKIIGLRHAAGRSPGAVL